MRFVVCTLPNEKFFLVIEGVHHVPSKKESDSWAQFGKNIGAAHVVVTGDPIEYSYADFGPDAEFDEEEL